LLPIAALIGSAPAMAQQQAPDTGDAPPPQPTEVPGAQGGAIYTPEDFARFAPRNALDMIRQVPGFQLRFDDGSRGFGQASENVVLNGTRFSSKSDGLESRLARIPAASVIRIEIVDGASLNIPGLFGQAANIVVKDTDAISGSFAWRGEVRAHYATPRFTNGEVSVKGAKGPVTYTLAFVNEANRGAAGGPTTIYGPDGLLLEQRRSVLTSDSDYPKLSANFAIAGPGTSLSNVNLSYRRFYERYNDDDIRRREGQADLERSIRSPYQGYDYEISGDHEFTLGPGRLKLIGLERFETGLYRETAIFTRADDTPAYGDRYRERIDSGERIARGEYSWKMLRGEWQAAVEGAFNRLDKNASLATLSPDGEFEPVPFPGGNGRVREDRYEGSLSYSTALTAKLQLQLIARGEYSRISSRTATGELTRSFQRPKGTVSLAWAPRKGLDISLNIQRKVGQLDFSDFLAEVFLEEGNANASNANLVPSQSWETEFAIKKDLGRWGTTNLRMFDRRFEDYIDIVPLPGGVEGRGNIDRAHRYGFEWTNTFKLEPLRIPGGRLDTNFILQTSNLTDPLDGQRRQLSDLLLREWSFTFRHDVPSSDLALGFGAESQRFSKYYRLREVGRQYEGPIFANIFIEHKNVLGMTVNARASNLFDARQRLIRTLYSGLRDRSAPLFFEDRNRLIGPIFKLTVSGNF
jgi:hypothetical protein